MSKKYSELSSGQRTWYWITMVAVAITFVGIIRDGLSDQSRMSPEGLPSERTHGGLQPDHAYGVPSKAH